MEHVPGMQNFFFNLRRNVRDKNDKETQYHPVKMLANYKVGFALCPVRDTLKFLCETFDARDMLNLSNQEAI